MADNNSKGSEWLKSFISPLIVGVVVLAGQSIIAPIVAKAVKTQESILEQKYEVCKNAVDIMQRYMASSKITGKSVSSSYTPPEKKKPTQVETNKAYALLAIFCENESIAEQFRKTFSRSDAKTVDSEDIVKFISDVRIELGVDESGYDNIDDYRYIFPHPINENGD